MKVEFRNILNRELIVTKHSSDLHDVLPIISQKEAQISICTKNNVNFFGIVDHCEFKMNQEYNGDIFVIYVGGLFCAARGGKKQEEKTT